MLYGYACESSDKLFERAHGESLYSCLGILHTSLIASFSVHADQSPASLCRGMLALQMISNSLQPVLFLCLPTVFLGMFQGRKEHGTLGLDFGAPR